MLKYTCSLNAKGERGHVEQKEVLHLLTGAILITHDGEGEKMWEREGERLPILKYTCGLNAEGERGHVEQEEVLHLLAGVAGQNGGLAEYQTSNHNKCMNL